MGIYNVHVQKKCARYILSLISSRKGTVCLQLSESVSVVFCEQVVMKSELRPECLKNRIRGQSWKNKIRSHR